jgi:membrane protein DedA with SNARE-associated domain
LARLKYLDLDILLVVVFLGIIFSDFFWYFLGEFLERRSKLVRKWMNKVSKPLDNRLHHKPFSTIFITRFAYGIYHATLIRAGALKLPLKPYLKTIVVSSIFWVSLVGGIAYFSSAYIGLFRKYLKYGEVALLIGIIIFLFISHFISKYTKKEIESNGNGDSNNK